MKHLTESEVVDLLEGTLAPDRQRHVDTCDACGAQAASLREALSRVSEADVPEPSPLFWDHLSARVHDAVSDATPEEPGGWFAWTRRATLPWAVAGTVATAVLVVGLWRASAPVARQSGAPAASATVAGVVSETDFDTFDPDTDEAWALVRTVADDLAWDGDDAPEGLGVRPGSAERAMADLTHAERSELVRLLAAEIRM